MLMEINKQMNISTISSVTNDSGQPEPVMYMNATIQKDGKPAISQAIENTAVYELKAEEVDADFAEFKRVVMEEAKRYTQSK